MTISKAVLAFGLMLLLASIGHSRPAQSHDMSSTIATNMLMRHAAASMDNARRPPPKPAAPRQQVIVVPPGTRVIYQQPKPVRQTYLVINMGIRRMGRLIDHDTNMVCYADLGYKDHAQPESVNWNCQPLPLSRAP